MIQDVFYVSAPCGSRKTTAASKRACDLASNGHNVLFVQPTRDLIKQTIDRFRDHDRTIFLEEIHGESGDGRVLPAVDAYVKLPWPEGSVLMITWEAFLNRIRHDAWKNWIVFIDEMPQAHYAWSVGGARTHPFITDHLDTKPLVPPYSEVIVMNRGELRGLIEDTDPDLKNLKKCARTLIHPDYTTYVDEVQFRALRSRKGKKAGFVAYSILNPTVIEGFLSATFLSARFEESLLYRLWLDMGVTFHEDVSLKSELAFAEHQNTHLVTILYGYEGGWSKSLRDKHDQRPHKALVAAVNERWKDESFAWLVNKDVEDSSFSKDERCRKLPHKSHGRNDFDHLHRVVVLSATNPNNGHLSFLQSRGISPDDARRETYCHNVYQSVMRISLRNPDDMNPKEIIVADRDCAEWLKEFVFPDATVESLGIDLGPDCQPLKRGRKHKYESNAARKDAHRNTKKARMTEFLDELNTRITMTESSDEASRASGPSSCDDIFFNIECQKSRLRFHGSVYSHIQATEPIHLFQDLTTEQFINAFRTLSKREIKKKEHAGLISPSLCDPTLSARTSRGKENVVFANGIWLDFEHGDLTHKEFSKIMVPYRVVAFNTYHHTDEFPRWRAYLPITEPITTDIYENITGQIRSLLESSGFQGQDRDLTKRHLKATGLDTGKLTAESMFNLPAQAKKASASFFKDYKGQFLDPRVWILNDFRDDKEPVTLGKSYDVSSSPIDDVTYQDAIDTWRSVGCLPGNGNDGIYKLLWGLIKSGVRGRELESAARSEASLAHTPVDRQRDITRFIEQLAPSLPK